MNDDIRVYGGEGRQQGKDRRHRAEALARFKRGHKTGDLVQGVFLRLETVPPGTAWVSLEGAGLLAALPDDLSGLARHIAAGQGAGAAPTGVTEADFPLRRGQTCYFVLEAVEPEPVLRMLSATEPKALAVTAAEARWRGLLRMPLAQLAARYTRQRSLLDKALHRDLWNQQELGIPFPADLPPSLKTFVGAPFAGEAPDSESPQGRYAEFMAHEEVREHFGVLEMYRAALVENLRPYGLLGFFFVPWVCPAARSLDLIYVRRSAGEAAPPGRAPARRGVTYKLQGLFESKHLQLRLDTLRYELAGILGGSWVLRRPGSDEPDLLQQILAFKPERDRSAFNRKV